MRLILIAACCLLLPACGQGEPVNAPTDPATPVTPPGPVEAVSESGRPGTGATSFIGRWAADVSWCAAPQGDRRPIEITATRFEGYENSCAILGINEVGTAYNASLSCASEGQTSAERIRMDVVNQIMTLTYLDRDAAAVELTKCTTLGDTSNAGPSLAVP